jgi:hypothetical protein
MQKLGRFFPLFEEKKWIHTGLFYRTFLAKTGY